MIASGRNEFLSQFPGIADETMQRLLAEPSREETFLRSRLILRERRENFRFYTPFRDLVHLRKDDEVFSLYGKGEIEGAVLSDRAFLLRFFGSGGDRLVLVNFGAGLAFAPAPQPLPAPPREQAWDMVFSSEEPRYGGSGTAPVQIAEGRRIPGEAAVIFASRSRSKE